MRINYISNALGAILIDIGIMIFVPVLVALFYREYGCLLSFFATAVFSLALGDILRRADSKTDEFNDIKRSEALVVASLAWTVFGLLACIPFVFYGFSFEDALFEAVSGITATGATILTTFDIPKTLLFWRSFTQWLGGMGIIVLFVAILPQFAVAGRQMFYAEAPGPTEEKFTPRIKNTASALWIVYAGLTVLCALCLWIAGMPVFDCICNAMSTLSAGGFSPNPDSIGGYGSNAIVAIVFIFMLIAGTSFVMQSKILTRGDFKLLWHNEEFCFYAKLVLTFSLLVALCLFVEQHYSLLHSLSAGAYQVVALATSTGSFSENYHLWNLDAKIILFMAMFLSSCSGSAGGGVKMTRWLVLWKYMKNEMYKILHPNAVMSIKIDNVTVSPQVIKQTLFFMFVYIAIFIVTAVLITMTEENLVVGTTSAIASLGDVGPGLGAIIGPVGSYASLNPFTKLILIFNMLIGRLEIIPFLVLFQKETWKMKK